MATLRTVFILALILATLPALYAAASPKRGDVATADAASWGRKLLEASGGDLDVDQQGGEEEEMGEVTDGLDEAVRVLLSWKQIKNAANQAAKSEAGQKTGGLAKNVVKKGGKDALTAAFNAFRSGKGAKGALQAGAGSGRQGSSAAGMVPAAAGSSSVKWGSAVADKVGVCAVQGW
ncbi:unnamed protein product [Closterium sp. Naga37s-1]|nr:unnamed protein product [Closterium sp. Naga37s-1]